MMNRCHTLALPKSTALMMLCGVVAQSRKNGKRGDCLRFGADDKSNT
jgi:hypothetical protein